MHAVYGQGTALVNITAVNCRSVKYDVTVGLNAWQKLFLALYLAFTILLLAGAVSTLVFELCAAAQVKGYGNVVTYTVWRALSLSVFGIILLANYPVAVLQLAFISIWPGDIAVWRVILQVLYESIVDGLVFGPICWVCDLCM